MSKSSHRTLLPKANQSRKNRSASERPTNIDDKAKISEQLKQRYRSHIYREKYIQDLQERNRRLKNEIAEITQILEEQQEKEKPPNPKDQSKKKQIVTTIKQDSNKTQVIKKELQNIYKQIKNYEREIEKIQNNRSGTRLASDQIGRLEVIKLQKLQHLDKLKTELSELSHSQVQNSKKLKNNIGRDHFENIIIKKGDELKVLREKLRNVEEKEKTKISNARRQLEYIKKLEKQLVESGIAMDEIEEMKRKNVYTQVKNIMNMSPDDRQLLKQSRLEKPGHLPEGVEEMPEDEIVTFEKLNEIKNEAKLFKKLHSDYDKRLSGLNKERQEAEKQIAAKKAQIEGQNQEITKLTQQINEVKALVRKNYPGHAGGTLGLGPMESIRKAQKRRNSKGGSKGGSRADSPNALENSLNRVDLGMMKGSVEMKRSNGAANRLPPQLSFK